MVSKKTNKVVEPSGHRFFDQVRADEAKARSESEFPFVHAMRRWLVSFEGAAAELGVTDGDLLDMAYQRKVFFVFHRPAGVEVRKVSQYVQHYDEENHIVCWRRFKSDQACRLNFDQGPTPGFLMPGCG